MLRNRRTMHLHAGLAGRVFFLLFGAGNAYGDEPVGARQRVGVHHGQRWRCTARCSPTTSRRRDGRRSSGPLGWSRQLRLTPLHPAAYIADQGDRRAGAGRARGRRRQRGRRCSRASRRCRLHVWIGRGAGRLGRRRWSSRRSASSSATCAGRERHADPRPGAGAAGLRSAACSSRSTSSATPCSTIAYWTPMYGVAELARAPLTHELPLVRRRQRRRSGSLVFVAGAALADRARTPPGSEPATTRDAVTRRSDAGDAPEPGGWTCRDGRPGRLRRARSPRSGCSSWSSPLQAGVERQRDTVARRGRHGRDARVRARSYMLVFAVRPARRARSGGAACHAGAGAWRARRPRSRWRCVMAPALGEAGIGCRGLRRGRRRDVPAAAGGAAGRRGSSPWPPRCSAARRARAGSRDDGLAFAICSRPLAIVGHQPADAAATSTCSGPARRTPGSPSQSERNRFARDLHDILGHSLTVITVKAELAGRLLDVDPARARAELADLERLARDALADVRARRRGLPRADPARRAGPRPRRRWRRRRSRPTCPTATDEVPARPARAVRVDGARGRHQRDPAQRRPPVHACG